MNTPEREIIARSMRAQIYGECTDNNWNACKHHWLDAENYNWLVQTTEK